MKLVKTLLVVVVFATPIHAYSSHMSTTHGEREVFIGVPASSPTSLLVMLHGFLSNGPVREANPKRGKDMLRGTKRRT
eukprot:1194217-Prorocentrum_minimum.AAC.3